MGFVYPIQNPLSTGDEDRPDASASTAPMVEHPQYFRQVGAYASYVSLDSLLLCLRACVRIMVNQANFYLGINSAGGFE